MKCPKDEMGRETIPGFGCIKCFYSNGPLVIDGRDRSIDSAQLSLIQSLSLRNDEDLDQLRGACL
jgi:hypothetical protein